MNTMTEEQIEEWIKGGGWSSIVASHDTYRDGGTLELIFRNGKKFFQHITGSWHRKYPGSSLKGTQPLVEKMQGPELEYVLYEATRYLEKTNHQNRQLALRIGYELAADKFKELEQENERLRNFINTTLAHDGE